MEEWFDSNAAKEMAQGSVPPPRFQKLFSPTEKITFFSKRKVFEIFHPQQKELFRRSVENTKDELNVQAESLTNAIADEMCAFNAEGGDRLRAQFEKDEARMLANLDKRSVIAAEVHARVIAILNSHLSGPGSETAQKMLSRVLWSMNWRDITTYGTSEATALRDLCRTIVQIEDAVASKLGLPSEAEAFLEAEGVSVEKHDRWLENEKHISVDVRYAKEAPLQGQSLENLEKEIATLLRNAGLKQQGDEIEVNTGGETGYSYIVPLEEGSYIILESWPEQKGSMKIIGVVRGEEMQGKSHQIVQGLIDLIKREEEDTEVYIEHAGNDAELARNGTIPKGVKEVKDLVQRPSVGGLRVEGRTLNATQFKTREEAQSCADAIAKILADESLAVEKAEKHQPGPCIVHNINPNGYSIFVPLTDSFVVVRSYGNGEVDLLADLCHFSRENSGRTCAVYAKIARLFGGSFSIHQGPHIP